MNSKGWRTETMQTNNEALPLFRKRDTQIQLVPAAPVQQPQHVDKKKQHVDKKKPNNNQDVTELFAHAHYCKCILMHWRYSRGQMNTFCTCTTVTSSVHNLPSHTFHSLLRRWGNRLSMRRRGEGWGAVGGFESGSFCRRLFGLRGRSSGCRHRPGCRVCCLQRRGCGWWGRDLAFRRRGRPRFGEQNRRLLVRLAGCGIHVEKFLCCWMGQGKQKDWGAVLLCGF